MIMNKLSIVEKAKRYDEAIKKLRSLHNNYDTVSTLIDVKEELENIFPELAESEDERVKKAIFGMAYDSDNELWSSYDVSKSDVLAWLEKQGEHADFRNKIQIGDKVTRNEDGILINLSQLNRVAKKDEKQGEQKPAEWNEQDEAMYNKAIKYINQSYYSEKIVIDWLKSIKDRAQSQWKPSEKQMELLREVQQALLGKDCHNRFVDFMYELKRLREK